MRDIKIGSLVVNRQDEVGIVLEEKWHRGIGRYVSIGWEDGSVVTYGPRLLSLLIKEVKNDAVSTNDNV